MTFTGVYYQERFGIAYDQTVYPEEKPVAAYFRFDSLGVENDSISDFYITQLLGAQASDNIFRFTSTLEAMAALKRGEVMAVMGPLAQLEYAIGDGLAVHQPPLPAFSAGDWTIGAAIHFSHKPLAYTVDDVIYAALSDGRIPAIFDQYNVTLSPPTLR